MIQWLKASTAGGTDSISGWLTKIPHATWPKNNPKTKQTKNYKCSTPARHIPAVPPPSLDFWPPSLDFCPWHSQEALPEMVLWFARHSYVQRRQLHSLVSSTVWINVAKQSWSWSEEKGPVFHQVRCYLWVIHRCLYWVEDISFCFLALWVIFIMKGCWILANDFLIIFFIYFLAVLGFRCCEGFSLGAASQDYSLLPRWGFSLWWLLLFQSTGSRAQAQ